MLGLVIGALTTWAIVVRAGSINPPAGAVGPTMNSLADIYALANQPPAPPPYAARYVQVLSPFFTINIDNFGGFLHSIILTSTSTQVQVLDVFDGGLQIASIHFSSQTGGETQVFPIDVTYQSSLQIVATTSPGPGFDSVTVSYLP